MIIALIVATALFVFWLQNYILSRHWDDQLYANVTFDSEPVFEGQDAVLTETIRNAKYLPLLTLSLKFQIDKKLQYGKNEHASVSDKCYKYDIYTLMPMKQVTRTMPIHCNGRGFFEIKSIDLASQDLFMLNHYVTVYDQYTSLYVFPKQLSTEELAFPFRSLMGSVITKRLTNEDPFEFRGLRDYQPYDPIRSINWKASAREGHTMVNVFDYTAGEELRIIINLEDDTHWREYLLLESAIRLASSLAAQMISYGIPVSVRSNGQDIVKKDYQYVTSGSSYNHLRSINEMLSRIDLEAPMMSILDIIQDEMLHDNATTSQITYLLIGYSQREDLCEAFAALTKQHTGSMWLLPLTPERSVNVVGTADFEVVRWEVRRAEK